MLDQLNSIDAIPVVDGKRIGQEWFCVRTQLKHEHIAAAHLERNSEIEVFLPRIRFVRSTRRGPVTVVESLFPNYVFARFDPSQHLNLVHYSTGVAGVVQFGRNRPTIPETVIDELKLLFGPDRIRSIPIAPEVGDTVVISNGVFEGLEAVVTRVLPSQQRVAVLLHFLGRQSLVELRTIDLTLNTRQEITRKLPFQKPQETLNNASRI